MSPVGEETVDAIKDQGFHLPPEPSRKPFLPSDLDVLTDEALMEDFSLLTAWADYANAQVGLAVISEREAELEYDKRVSDHYATAPKAKSVTQAKAEVLQDPKVYEARQELDRAHAYRRMVTDLADRYERDAAVMSRELTRRTSEAAVKRTRRDKWKP